MGEYVNINIIKLFPNYLDSFKALSRNICSLAATTLIYIL